MRENGNFYIKIHFTLDTGKFELMGIEKSYIGC